MEGRTLRGSLLALACSAFAVAAAEFSLSLSPPKPLQAYSFSLVGGTPGKFGHTDGVGTNALFGGTTGLATDRAGNLYIADALLLGQTIRKMSPDRVVSTIAGKSGDAAEVDGVGTAARFHSPYAVTADADGTLYVADFFGQTIRQVTPAGVVTTLAGLAFSQGSVDGFGKDARFGGPTGIALGRSGYLYVADQSEHTIRKVTLQGQVTTIAGLPLARGTNDGVGKAARFNYPRALTVASDGNIYVADSQNSTIRKVTPGGLVSTLAGAPGQSAGPDIVDGQGSAARFVFLTGIAADSLANLYVVDSYQYVVRKVTLAGVVTTLRNQYDQPIRFKFGADHSSIAVDQDDNLYVADAGDSTILKGRSVEGRFILLSVISLDPFSSSGTAEIQVSTDLKTWTPFQTLPFGGFYPTKVLDTNSPALPWKFYRALRL